MGKKHVIVLSSPGRVSSKMQQLILPVLLASFWTICTGSGGESDFIHGWKICYLDFTCHSTGPKYSEIVKEIG